MVNEGCKQDEEIKRGETSRNSSGVLYHPEPTIAMQNSPLRAFDERLSEQRQRQNSEAGQRREPEEKTKGTAEGHHQSVLEEIRGLPRPSEGGEADHQLLG